MSKITFCGILGYNCGEVVPYVGNNKRLKEKGIVVKDGIPTLRGYAKISDLAAASKTKYEEYQRKAKQEHIEDITNFLDNCKSEAKFLPEVVLSVNSIENLTLKKYGHKAFSAISATAKGAIENLDYYILEVDGSVLSRVDGNHRLEAGKYKDLYVPFSIVLWNVDIDSSDNLLSTDEKKVNTESEAFLFYILNNTARKLEAEENYKGLVKSEKWTKDELLLINKHLPLLKYFYNKYHNNPLIESKFILYPMSQICEVLEDIDDVDLEESEFDVLIRDAFVILSQTIQFNYIKKEFSNIFFQLSLYARYKSHNLDVTIKNLQLIDKWLEKYKYRGTTFTKASKIYEVAYKHINVSPKYIFMAMEYKSKEMVNDYNNTLSRAVHSLNNMGSSIEVINYPIMTGEGKSINITNDIYEKIDNCSIFIADTTEANPNVMYELGIAYSKQKPIILVRDKTKKKFKVPSDIISDYYYEFSSMTELESIFTKHIKNILEIDFGAVFSE